MNTNINQNVLELSKKHRVLLLFLRHLGCIFCRWGLHEISTFVLQLLANNVLPVIVHQETSETYENFINTYSGLADVKDILIRVPHVADPTGQSLYKQFGLQNISLMAIIARFREINTRLGAIQKIGYSQSGPDPYLDVDRCASMQLGGAFLVEQGRIINQYRFKTASDPLDLLLFSLVPTSEVQPASDDAPQQQQAAPVTSALEPGTQSGEQEVTSTSFEPTKEAMMHIEQLTSIPVFQRRDTALNAGAIVTGYTAARIRARKERYSTSRKSKLLCMNVDEDDSQPSTSAGDVSPFDMNQHGTRLRDALQSPRIRKYWIVFASSEFNSENLLFWQAVDRYRKVAPKNRIREAQTIVETYLEPTALLGINTSSTLLEEVRATMQRHKDDNTDLPQNLFDAITGDVEMSVLADSFTRFCQSSLYKEATKIGSKSLPPLLPRSI